MQSIGGNVPRSNFHIPIFSRWMSRLDCYRVCDVHLWRVSPSPPNLQVTRGGKRATSQQAEGKRRFRLLFRPPTAYTNHTLCLDHTICNLKARVCMMNSQRKETTF